MLSSAATELHIPAHGLFAVLNRRYRKGTLYTLYQLETLCLFFVACYMVRTHFTLTTSVIHELITRMM
jgi:hypothetical protein